jgi:hypothetical protein
MEIAGKIFSILELQTGEGKNGTWRKQSFVLETMTQYPKKICITVWGDNIDKFPLVEGAEVLASIDLESREYNGRWYTDVKAWKVVSTSAGPSSPADDFDMEFPPPPPEEEESLPF